MPNSNKLRLHSLASNVNRGNRTAGTALVTKHDRRINLKGYTTALSCSFCKARNLSHEGHVWQDCRRLKRHKDKKSKNKKSTPTTGDTRAANTAEALVADAIPQTADVVMADAYIVSNPPLSEWKFDTGSSAHMTDNIGLFEHLTPNHGFVRVGGN